MRSIFALVIFIIVFLAMGVGTHFAIFQKPGLFVWSKSEQGGMARSILKKDGVKLVRPKQDAPEPLIKNESANRAEVAPKPVVEVAPLPEPPKDPTVIRLFNGRDLGHWKVTQYGGEGKVFINDNSELVFDFGAILTGVHWNTEPPQTSNYEISLEAMKLAGNDFFCGLTFPVKDSHATFVVGGWGGGAVGISSVDDLSAFENETSKILDFTDDVWHQIRLKVTDAKIEAWLDGNKTVDLDLEDRKISLLPGDIELSVPIGLTSFKTRAKYRNITWKNLPD